MPTFEINIVWFIILIALSCIGALILLIVVGVWLLFVFERILSAIEFRKDMKERKEKE